MRKLARSLSEGDKVSKCILDYNQIEQHHPELKLLIDSLLEEEDMTLIINHKVEGHVVQIRFDYYSDDEDESMEEFTIKTASMKGGIKSELGWTDFRIDRKSPLGNPFEITTKYPELAAIAARSKVIAAYKQWLWDNLKLAQKQPRASVPLETGAFANITVSYNFKHPSSGKVVSELKRLYELSKTRKVRLLCWCSPKSCHGDVIISCLQSMRTNRELRSLLNLRP
ncbi:MAG: DUF4326 domain-containing protein [Symploca sp. SIO2E6]|nr:DUF4326 domain-containing protein [Symploca sp. SIO2E6]